MKKLYVTLFGCLISLSAFASNANIEKTIQIMRDAESQGINPEQAIGSESEDVKSIVRKLHKDGLTSENFVKQEDGRYMVVEKDDFKNRRGVVTRYLNEACYTKPGPIYLTTYYCSFKPGWNCVYNSFYEGRCGSEKQ